MIRIFLSVVFLSISFCAVDAHAEWHVSGSVVDEAALHKGGTLGLSAFKAGPGAEANDQLDKLSLMLIKGIRDVLTQRTTVWHIADAGQDNVDFVLDGYIEELSQSGKFSRLILRKNKTNLSVDGEIWSQATGGKVLVFASSEIINIKKQELMDQAYAMGQAIGEFIAAQAKE